MEAVFSKVFLCRLIGVPEEFCLMIKVDQSIHLSDEFLILESNDSFCIQGFFILAAVFCRGD